VAAEPRSSAAAAAAGCCTCWTALLLRAAAPALSTDRARQADAKPRVMQKMLKKR